MPFASWLAKIFNRYFEEQKPQAPSYLCDFDRITQEVRPADVLLVEGVNRVSKVIQRLSLSPWSHAALYLGKLHDIKELEIRELVHKHYRGSPNDQLIIESLIGKGTVISSLDSYSNNHVRICRPSGLAYSDAQRVINNATKTLGYEYNIRQIFDLARFLLKSRFIPQRWGSGLFKLAPGKASQDICSTMIARAFSAVKFPILPVIRENQQHRLEFIHRNPKLFTPSDFDYSPYFNIIKYPILSLTSPAYRELPWNEELISHDDEIIGKKNNKT